MMRWQRINIPLARLACRHNHTGTEFPLRPFKNREPGPPIEPTYIRGEGKFVIPESVKDKGPIVIPPILDLSWAAKRRRHREVWYRKVEKLGTVEEKIFELNMPRYYGWKSTQIEEGSLPYDPLPHIQYITTTHMESEPYLPPYYDDLLSPEELDASVQQIKSQVEDAIALEYTCRNWDYQLTKEQLEDKLFIGNLRAKSISEQVNRIFLNNLSAKYNHLLEAQVDIGPRLEAFWFFGGFEVPEDVVRARSGKSRTKELKDEPINEAIQYKGSPLLHLRHKFPLREIMTLEQSEELRTHIPYEPLDLRKVGYFKDLKRATVIPGFWPGECNEFGLLSYNSTVHLATRPEGFNDNKDAIKAQAILGSYSWLYTQACYQGFSTFQDPTYPLVNQMILTDGQSWNFSVYQLNTTRMHIDAINENKKANVCWITEPMKLFETIENGQVKGLNEDVLKYLLKFYVNVPQVREGINMKPYLNSEQVIANIEDDERREWLENHYKHLQSNRARHRPMPEIYDWQRIYMIKFKTRPMDKKREPWEFGINVYKRRLDDHAPVYIPRCLREHHRSKKKFKKNYYPSVPEEELKA